MTERFISTRPVYTAKSFLLSPAKIDSLAFKMSFTPENAAGENMLLGDKTGFFPSIRRQLLF
jgi:hypothetical protein